MKFTALTIVLALLYSLSSAYPKITTVNPCGPYIPYAPDVIIAFEFSEPVMATLPDAVTVSGGYRFEVTADYIKNNTITKLYVKVFGLPYPGSFSITLKSEFIKDSYNYPLDGQNIGAASNFNITFKFNEPYMVFRAGEQGWFPVDQTVLGSITIYNYNGQELITLQSNQWDGTDSRGIMLRGGAYIFIIKNGSGKEIMKGRLTLIK